MFKTFIASVLAAAANAAADGNNFDNMVAYPLIPDVLHLNMYNARNENVNELHGELEWLDQTARENTREMGFCMQPKTNAVNWDCMQIRFSVDPAELEETPAASRKFQVIDGFSATDLSGYTNDEGWEALVDAEKNWRSSTARSSMTECVADEDDEDLTSCKNATSHWYRNFITDNATEDAQFGGAYEEAVAEEDETEEALAARQVALDESAQDTLDADSLFEYIAVGWVATYASTTYGSGSDDFRLESSDPITITPVFPAYAAAVKAGEAEPSPAPDSEDEDEDEDENANEDDGATAVTTFAAAAMAAVCALAF